MRCFSGAQCGLLLTVLGCCGRHSQALPTVWKDEALTKRDLQRRGNCCSSPTALEVANIQPGQDTLWYDDVINEPQDPRLAGTYDLNDGVDLESSSSYTDAIGTPALPDLRLYTDLDGRQRSLQYLEAQHSYNEAVQGIWKAADAKGSFMRSMLGSCHLIYQLHWKEVLIIYHAWYRSIRRAGKVASRQPPMVSTAERHT